MKASTGLAAALLRSIDFGVKTTSGRAGTGVGLPTQQVEVGRRGRRVGDGHVVLGAQLQVALDARRAVVGALALVAVRQEQHDRAALAPLLLRAADELVDDGLGAVAEVAELGLPEDEGVGPLDGVAVLEAHRGVLGQERVVDPEAGLALTEVEQRRPLLGGVLVDEHRVPLDERAAAAVLAGEAHRGALLEQRAEGEELGHRPVDAAVADHLRHASP